jgi:hypothetical protein
MIRRYCSAGGDVRLGHDAVERFKRAERSTFLNGRSAATKVFRSSTMLRSIGTVCAVMSSIEPSCSVSDDNLFALRGNNQFLLFCVQVSSVAALQKRTIFADHVGPLIVQLVDLVLDLLCTAGRLFADIERLAQLGLSRNGQSCDKRRGDHAASW